MTTNNSSANPNAPVVKKPYEKPMFRYAEVFVTTALQCGKGTGAPPQHCAGPKKS